MSTLHLCTDLFDAPPTELAAAIRGEAAQPPKFRLAADSKLLWTVGDVLYVRFLEPDPVLDELVLEIARTWCQYASITFERTIHRDADIRITYTGTSNQSKIGKASRPRDGADTGPSMWLPSARDEAMRQRVVLHEFGHALGCLHEHSSPNATIPWKRELLLATYEARGWPRAWTEHNVLRRYDQPHVRATKFDEHSIMLYPIDAELVEDPAYAVGWNMELSDADKAFIRQLYP